VCRADAGQCDVAETCTGSSGACPVDNFEPQGTSCGDSSSNACTAADSCDGGGVCQPNNLSCSYVTNSDLCTFDYDRTLSGRQFNVIFTPDVQIWPGYKQNSTNPGQYYYNAIVTGSAGNATSVTFSIPWPFVTQGANPVHLYDAEDIGVNANYCFRDSGQQLPINGIAFPATITYADWAAGALPKSGSANGGYSYSVDCDSPAAGSLPNELGHECTVTVDFPMPQSGKAYVNMHLDFGTKGAGTNFNPVDTTVDRYDQGANVCTGDQSYFNAMKNVAPTATPFDVALATCHAYEFSHTGPQNGSDTVANVNSFKKINGVFGQALSSSNGAPWPNVPVSLKLNNQIVASGVTDQDGYYALNYKHTGKAANFTVTIGNVSKVVQLKANGWAEVSYDVTTGTWTVDVK